MRAYSELTRYSCPELSGEDELTIFWGFNFFPKFVWFGKFGKGFLGVCCFKVIKNNLKIGVVPSVYAGPVVLSDKKKYGVDFLFPETLWGLGKGVVGSMF